MTQSRNASIISALASGATLAAVAAEHGLSRARVGQIYRAAKGKPRAAGRPVSTGRGAGAVVNVRLAPAELAAIVTAAGGRPRAAEYLRAAGLAAAQPTPATSGEE